MSRQSSPCVHSRRPVCTLDGGVNGLRFVPVDEDDPLAQPLLAELAVEYATRYEAPESGVARWLRDHPADQFRPPDGGMVIGLLDGQPVTGGGVLSLRRRHRRTQTDLDRQRASSPWPCRDASGGAGGRDRPPRLPADLLDDR